MLSLCIITKNEEKFLGNCLESVGQIAAEIIVVDAFSTDLTREIAATYTDKIFLRKWNNDFSAARNYAMSLAACDWVLFIDADEYLINPTNIPELLQSADASSTGGYAIARKDKFIHKESGKPDSYYSGIVRLVRNHPEIRWRNAIHEEIHSAIEVAGFDIKVAKTFGLIHQVDQYTADELYSKQTNYLTMLNRALESAPENHWLIYHRAKTLWFLDKRSDAEKLYSYVAFAENAPRKIKVSALNHLAMLLAESSRYPQALEMIDKSIRLMPGQSVGYLVRFDVHYEMDRMEDALQSLELVKTDLSHCNYQQVTPGDIFQRKDLVLYKQGCVYFAKEAYRDAEESYRKGIEYDPESVDNLYGLALLYAKTNDRVLSERYIDECLKLAPDWVDAQVLKEFLGEK